MREWGKMRNSPKAIGTSELGPLVRQLLAPLKAEKILQAQVSKQPLCAASILFGTDL